MATVDTHAVVESGLALGGALVTRVGQPAVGLEQDGGAQVLLTVPPVGRARGRAAGAQNAFVETVELPTVLRALAVLKTLQKSSQNGCGWQRVAMGNSRLGWGYHAGGKA